LSTSQSTALAIVLKVSKAYKTDLVIKNTYISAAQMSGNFNVLEISFNFRFCIMYFLCFLLNAMTGLM